MITGGTITRVTAERIADKPNPGMDINIQLKDVKFDKIKVTVKYTYTITFKDNTAKMEMEGELYFDESERDVKEIRDKWDKTKQLPDNFASDMLTAITYSCSAVGTLLAFAINVNAPINVPRAKIGQAPVGKEQQAA